MRDPEGVPPALWRRLCVFGSWATAAGHPLGRLSRPIDLDDAGVLTVATASAHWARELETHRETLLQELRARSGQPVARLRTRIDPDLGRKEDLTLAGESLPPLAPSLPGESLAAPLPDEAPATLEERLERLWERYCLAVARARPPRTEC